VDQSSDDFLADPRATLDQHFGVGPRRCLYLAPKIGRHGAISEHEDFWCRVVEWDKWQYARHESTSLIGSAFRQIRELEGY
jgi:hypothetical protein